MTELSPRPAHKRPMTITISLSDPGMHPRSVTVSTLEEVPAALKAQTLYTEAGLSSDGKLLAFVNREVGETRWTARSTRHGRALGMSAQPFELVP